MSAPPGTRGHRRGARARCSRRPCRARRPASRRPAAWTESDPAPLVAAQVDHRPTARRRDLRDRGVELGAAVAAVGAHHLPGQTLGVDPHQDLVAVEEPPVCVEPGDKSDVPVAVHLVGVANGGEHAVAGRHPCGDHTADEQLRPTAVLPQVVDRDHRQVVFIGEGAAAGCPAHAAVVLDQLGNDPGRLAAGELGEIHGRLGVPGRTSTPPSRARSGRTCPGRRRSPGSVRESASSRAVCARSLAEMPVVMPSRASTLTANAVCIRSSFCCTIAGIPSRSSAAPVIGTHTRPERGG